VHPSLGVLVLDRLHRSVTTPVGAQPPSGGAAWLGVPVVGLVDPVAVEPGPGGGVLVLDAGANAIVDLDEAGRRRMTIGGYGRGQAGMSCPHDLVVAPDGIIYVADSGNRRIQRYTLDGTCLGPWGSYGDGPDQFIDPTGVAIGRGGELLVADHYGHRIQVFSTQTGKELVDRRLTLPPHVRYPSRIAALPDGQCVITCTQLSEVWMFPCP
jgi:DNA-binding beta-propeller fold protein YncE